MSPFLDGNKEYPANAGYIIWREVHVGQMANLAESAIYFLNQTLDSKTSKVIVYFYSTAVTGCACLRT